MATQLFVNLPVKDLERARSFWDTLGFTFDARFTDENATCLVIGENIGVMLLTEPYFTTFVTKEIADTSRTTEAILALGVESRARVDEIADGALAAGGSVSMPPMDEGFMYSRSFQDPDGHLWEVLHMSGMPES